MENDTNSRSAPSSSQGSQRATKMRSRISAACIRCQKRKIRCDALSPACSACQKAGATCIGGGTSREIPRSYVNELETRIEWLESIIRENLPEVDLNAGPCQQSEGRRGNLTREIQPSQPHRERVVNSEQSQDDESLNEITDQFGLISVATGSDLRYLGPSSGLFFTRFVLSGLGRTVPVEKPSSLEAVSGGFSVPADLLVARPEDLPSDQRHAQWLSKAYFDSVHLQFPFLHEPTHMEIIRKLYHDIEVEPTQEFQVFMVLAIGATILSRRAKVLLSAEGYCASAMSRLDNVFQSSSLTGVQCILLLQMYTINNQSSGLSLWNLHYHCLAAVMELGLQRNIPGKRYSFFEKELRNRSFWCVYTIDRALSTLMGRPIGLMDEQCELLLSSDLNDEDLEAGQSNPGSAPGSLTNMTSAIHLFKGARFNSEIKCILYCVDRQYPPYTQPAITDVVSWQNDMISRLQQWKAEIPQHPEGSPRHFMNLICEIKYHELVMLVLRPSPLFHHPTKAAIRESFSSAMKCSKLYHTLYATNSLHYSWISVHSLFLCVITMFYCVWTPNGVADEVNFDALMRALKSTSDILSATGEYWPEAKRSRDVLDRVSAATMRRFTQNLNQTQNYRAPPRSLPSTGMSSDLSLDRTLDISDSMSHNLQPFQFDSEDFSTSPFSLYGAPTDSFVETDLLSYFMGSRGDTTLSNNEIPGDQYPNVDEVMQSFFGEGGVDFGNNQ